MVDMHMRRKQMSICAVLNPKTCCLIYYATHFITNLFITLLFIIILLLQIFDLFVICLSVEKTFYYIKRDSIKESLYKQQF